MTLSVTGNITTSAGNVYVSSGNTAITWLSICNTSAGNVLANVFVVPSGFSSGSTTQVYQDLLMVPGETYQIYAAAEKLILADQDSVQIQCNTSSALNAVTSYTSI